MLNQNCAACGGVLQRAEGNTAICMKCFRTYDLASYCTAPPNPAFQRKTGDEMDKDARIGLVMVLAFLALIFAGVGILPLSALLVAVIVKQCVRIAQQPDESRKSEKQRIVAFGEYLKERSDYICALRDLPLGTMPLGIYGERAAEQIERLAVKQEGLKAMLGKNHPFVQSADGAEAYILDNCKKVLWRLKFCDQTDAGLCRLHAQYLQGVLDDNEKVLLDYEKLLIEVTQMDETEPVTAPNLDVLAETLHSVRTGGLEQRMML